ncbi:hypothetical protein [Photobacterium phosphoreum]|uniref:hypothetical protein n=1 Tax=Photobacterium phosphoreum TaxID=659 RepID=UPI0012EABDF6|nr:hypothetical protein [Photobacterium phosphoreum]MCD9477966.1 hypothetical protein [Photobacterium phosphoreum]
MNTECSSRWQMADGRWQMADGRWQMADGRWQMAEKIASVIKYNLLKFEHQTQS